MKQLAALPNVYAELSGLPQAPGRRSRSAASFLPVRVAADTFDAARLNACGIGSCWFRATPPAGAVRACVAKVFDATEARDVWEDGAAAVPHPCVTLTFRRTIGAPTPVSRGERASAERSRGYRGPQVT